jgi:hypothetical protein
MVEGSFTVLQKIFANPGLPESWLALRDQAYSNAHLRAAAQAYRASAFQEGCAHLEQALQLHPALRADGGAALAGRMVAWANSHKTADPLKYLAGVYAHLPESLAGLRARRRQELATIAVQMAFDAFGRRRFARARYAIWNAVRFQPSLLKNAGVRSLLVRSSWPVAA